MSLAIDDMNNTSRSRASFSSNQELPVMYESISKDHRLKRAAAQERRQATRSYCIFD